MTRRQWSLVVLMILINYLIFSQLFNRIMNTDVEITSAMRTPDATFTATATLDYPIVVPPTLTPNPNPNPGPSTPTNTLVRPSEEQAKAATATVGAERTQQAQVAQQTGEAQQGPAPQPSATPTPEPVDTTPRVTAGDSAVNLRAGPGTNYDRVGALAVGQSLEIVGRNAGSSWWQVSTVNGLRWIAASVTTASNVDNNIPVVAAPPTPTGAAPTDTPPPPEPSPTPLPQFQYSISNIFGQVNEAITQIRGEIKDSAGNPVDGVRVRVRSGTFCTVSVPSGRPGVYPPGVYDILLDNRAKDGTWQVAIVNGPADGNDTQCSDSLSVLSEEVTVPTNTLEGVVFVEWRKNF